MFRQIFTNSRRFFRRIPLVISFVLPIWLLNKSKMYTVEVPKIKGEKKSVNLEIQQAETIPETIGQADDKNVIVYFMSGNEEEDSLVKKLLTTYKNQYNQNIQVIFIKPSIDPHSIQLHHTFLTKRNYSKDIMRVPFKEELDKLSPQEFINTIAKRLDKFIHKIPQITQENLSSIPNSKQPKVILRSDKNSPAYKKHRILFENFMQKPFAFKKIQFLIVTDEEAAKALGIDSANQGSIHMLVPSQSQFLKQEAQNNFLSIGSNQFALVKQVTNDNILKQNFIFMPFTNQAFQPFLELKINNNKITSQQKQRLFSIFKTLNHPAHITYSNSVQKYQLHYSLYDNLSYKILKQELPEFTVQQKIDHLTTPKQWLFKDEFQKPRIQQWIEKIRRGELQPYYKSQPNPKIDIHSHKLTGRNFQEILVSTDNQVVFFYSNNCHTCAVFGELYEDIAKSNYSDDKLVMNHIEVQKNEMQCGYNTPVTPVLSFFKLQSKTRPFTYDLGKINKESINNFIDITRDVKLVDDELFNKFIGNRQGYHYEL